MNYSTGIRLTTVLAAGLLLSSCAGTETLVATPKVQLTSVELQKVSFNKQTFLLGFEVFNPNAFPLPVEEIRYQILFDGQRFAGGETQASFTIPSQGIDAFAISVDLDILNRATQITSLLQGGMPENVSYEVEGSLTVDIPFTRPIGFASSGIIDVQD